MLPTHGLVSHSECEQECKSARKSITITAASSATATASSTTAAGSADHDSKYAIGSDALTSVAYAAHANNIEQLLGKFAQK